MQSATEEEREQPRHPAAVVRARGATPGRAGAGFSLLICRRIRNLLWIEFECIRATVVTIVAVRALQILRGLTVGVELLVQNQTPDLIDLGKCDWNYEAVEHRR